MNQHIMAQGAISSLRLSLRVKAVCTACLRKMGLLKLVPLGYGCDWQRVAQSWQPLDETWINVGALFGGGVQ